MAVNKEYSANEVSGSGEFLIEVPLNETGQLNRFLTLSADS